MNYLRTRFHNQSERILTGSDGSVKTATPSLVALIRRHSFTRASPCRPVSPSPPPAPWLSIRVIGFGLLMAACLLSADWFSFTLRQTNFRFIACQSFPKDDLP